MKINSLISIIATVLIAIIVASGSYNIYSSKIVEDNINEIKNVILKNEKSLAKLNEIIFKIKDNQKKYYLSNSAETLKDIEDQYIVYQSISKELVDFFSDKKKEKELLEVVNLELENYIKQNKVIDKILKIAPNPTIRRTLLTQKMSSVFIIEDKIDENLKLLNESFTLLSNTTLSAINDSVNNSSTIALFFSIVTILFAMILPIIFIKYIVQPLKNISSMAHFVSQGDLEKSDMKINLFIKEILTLNDAMFEIIGIIGDFDREFISLIKASEKEEFDIRCDVSKFKGVYADVLLGANGLMDILVMKVEKQNEIMKEIKVNSEFQEKEIEKLISVFKSISDKDLSSEYFLSDKFDNLLRDNTKESFVNIQNNLDSSLTTLNEVLSRSREIAQDVKNASEQVSSSSGNLSDGSIKQAAAIEEISSSFQEVNQMFKRISKDSEKASNNATETKKLADKGNIMMQNLVISMSEVNEFSKNITKILKTIDDIAFQTNLLALNAAVEAARAGKHGKGFAVVAEEVRNLAARSAKAATETGELLDVSSKKISNSIEITDKTKVFFDKIMNSSLKSAKVSTDISNIIDNQSNVVIEINSNLDSINNVVIQNSSVAEQTAASALEMTSMANEMEGVLGEFLLKNSKRNEFNKEIEFVADEEVEQVFDETKLLN